MTWVDELAPEEGLVAEYLDFAGKHVMGAPEFHLFAALSAVSTLIGASWSFRLGGSTWHPNLWIVLVARSGIGKSTPLRFAARLVDDVLQDAMLPYDWSREALWDALSQNPAGYLWVDEFGGFLARSGRDYNTGLKQDFCQWYDGAGRTTKRTTKKDGTIKIEDAALTVIGSCPVDEIVEHARTGDLRQGFLTRFLFVPQVSDTPYVGIVEEDEGQRTFVRDLMRKLAAGRRRPITITIDGPLARQWESYDRQSRTRAEKEIPELSGFWARRGIHTLKLACLLSAARHYEPVLDAEELERADKIMHVVLETIGEIVSGEVGLNRDQRVRKTIYDAGYELAKQSGGSIPLRAWLRRVQYLVRGSKELRELASMWAEAGSLTIERQQTGQRGPQTEVVHFNQPPTLRVVPAPEGEKA